MKAGLLDNVVSVYDQTKTTIQGRVSSKVIGGQTVLGPPLTKFIDVFTDTGLTPSNFYVSPNGRMIVLGAITNGTTYDTMPIALYDFNLNTGAYSYVGQIIVQLPNIAATTTTIRGLRLTNDSTNTGWKIAIATTANVLINGGLFLVNKIDKADFVPVSIPTIPMATASDAKAVYLLQDPSNIGVNQLNTASVGAVLDETANRIYVHNGVAATHQYFVYSTNTAPTYENRSVSVSVASPGVVSDAGHSYNNNDPVLFTAGTLPTGLTVGTIYFVRNAVAGTSYELSATSGGASINTTGSPSVGAVIGRAWGTTGSNWVHKTGNLPALSGTLLANDSENLATPIAAPVNGGVLNGNNCAFLSTSTTLYLGLLSELTSGATTWPSLTSSNILGTTNQITAPTNAQAQWSNYLDAATYLTNTSRFVVKQVVNNVIVGQVGAVSNQYMEGAALETVKIGSAAVSSFSTRNGWHFISGSTVGQRGIVFWDHYSTGNYGFSYLTTKVLDNPNATLKFITSWRKLYDQAGQLSVQYRTSGFGSITGGWISLPNDEDLSSFALSSNQIQFKVLFRLVSTDSSSFTQIYELFAGVEANNATSDNWEFSRDNSSNASPSRSAWRLKTAYTTSVPQLYFRAYNLSDALLVNHNTVTNAANFEYSTDNGMTWLPLGTIPNTVGTLVRYTFTSPPGVDIRPGLKES